MKIILIIFAIVMFICAITELRSFNRNWGWVALLTLVGIFNLIVALLLRT